MLPVPNGDVLVVAGDITNRGNLNDVVNFSDWAKKLPHKHKIIIAGNHDFCFEDDRHDQAVRILTMQGLIYLQDSEITIDGVKFYGSPWSPWFYDWAFNLHRGFEIREKWALIPKDTDVLITHGPIHGHGDMTDDGQMVGCTDLAETIQKVQPEYHIFGHIHEGYGVTYDEGLDIKFVNASTCTRQYLPTNPPLEIEI